MIKVTIDGQPMQASLSGINSMPDLIEFIKASIDPESIISGIFIGGRPLAEVDWRVPLSVQGDSVLEITTDTQGHFLSDRLDQAGAVVDLIVNEFVIAREAFQAGKTDEGNRAFSKAVQDLHAFLGWYDGILQMLPSKAEPQQTSFRAQIDIITRTCEQLLQQQLYHSWWALGETVKRDLEPQLVSMKTSCETFSSSWA